MFFAKNLIDIDHCFFSKLGGTSNSYYSTLNCGKGSKDNETKITKNYKIISKYFDLKVKNIQTLNQSHSNKVFTITNNKISNSSLYYDGIVTKKKNIILGILTADCAPILFYDPLNKIIGACHAGWKGSLNGILENTINAMKNLGARSNSIKCAIGPCISQDSYQVSLDFYLQFILENPSNRQFFESEIKKDKFRFSLKKYIKYKLTNYGIQDISSIPIDTFKQDHICFSYRKSIKKKENDYGRMISTIVIKD